MKKERGIPQVEPHPDGFVLLDASDTPAAAFGSLGCSGCLVVISLLVAGFVFAAASATGSAGAVLVTAIFALVFFVVGAAMFWTAVKKFRVIQAWEPGELVLPVWPMPLGNPVEVRFRRKAKTADPTGMVMVGRLVLTESVTYRQGTDTRTVTEDVAEYPVELSTEATSSGIEAAMSLEVPANAPPSFELDNNRLQWWLHVAPIDEGDGSEFKLWVRPEAPS